jgi:hypothetical protein
VVIKLENLKGAGRATEEGREALTNRIRGESEAESAEGSQEKEVRGRAIIPISHQNTKECTNLLRELPANPSIRQKALHYRGN